MADPGESGPEAKPSPSEEAKTAEPAKRSPAKPAEGPAKPEGKPAAKPKEEAAKPAAKPKGKGGAKGAMAKCPVCGNAIKAENLARHLQSVHPRAPASVLREAERKAAKVTAERAKGRPAAVRTGLPWSWIVALVVAIVILSGLWYFVSSLPPPPVDIRGCPSNVAVHFHPWLKITVNGDPVDIPDTIGKAPTGCFWIVHTHTGAGEVDGQGFRTLHFEGPQHPYVIGDFFTAWGESFSRDQILTYYRSGGATLQLLVDGVTSDLYENHAVRDGMRLEVVYTS